MTRGLGPRDAAMTPVDAGQDRERVAEPVRTGSTATAAATAGAARAARIPLSNGTNHATTNHATTNHATRMRTGS